MNTPLYWLPNRECRESIISHIFILRVSRSQSSVCQHKDGSQWTHSLIISIITMEQHSYSIRTYFKLNRVFMFSSGVWPYQSPHAARILRFLWVIQHISIMTPEVLIIYLYSYNVFKSSSVLITAFFYFFQKMICWISKITSYNTCTIFAFLDLNRAGLK